MNDELPPELTEGAIHRYSEYAWELAAFPVALRHAPSLGYACLGGQFWFLFADNSVYEPFWLQADASDRKPDGAWSEYARASCEEVLSGFNTLVEGTAFEEEAKKFRSLQSPYRVLFNAYFVTESEYSELQMQKLNHQSRYRE
jgi:hypothetical protein